MTVTPKSRDYPGIALWISLVVTSALWLLPFLFMFLTSVKSQAEISAGGAWSLPVHWAWENYGEAWDRGRMSVTGLNSLFVAAVKVPLGLLISALTAFAIARLSFWGHKALLFVIAVGAMLPVQVALTPLFRMANETGTLNSVPALIVPYLAFGIPYQVFMLYGFFSSIPRELDEAARIDGASSLRLFFQVILPLAKPGLAALAILDFVGTWNEFAIATTLMKSYDSWTVPLALQGFNSQFGTDYGPLNAFIIMSVLPVLIVYLMFQRYFVSGALAGALKG